MTVENNIEKLGNTFAEWNETKETLDEVYRFVYDAIDNSKEIAALNSWFDKVKSIVDKHYATEMATICAEEAFNRIREV